MTDGRHPRVIGRGLPGLRRRTLGDMPDPITEEMRLEQIEKAREEHRRAREATEEADAESHGRRAERADYLREKLAERAKAEDETAAEDAEE